MCAGIPDKDEAKVAAAIKAGTMKDTDGDGIPDHLDNDDDGDGEWRQYACVRAHMTDAIVWMWCD